MWGGSGSTRSSSLVTELLTPSLSVHNHSWLTQDLQILEVIHLKQGLTTDQESASYHTFPVETIALNMEVMLLTLSLNIYISKCQMYFFKSGMLDCSLGCNWLLSLNSPSEKLCSFSQIFKKGMKKAFKLKPRDIVSATQGQRAENRPTVMQRRASCGSNLNWETMSHIHWQPPSGN